MPRLSVASVAVVLALALPALAQTPQPFPRAGAPQPQPAPQPQQPAPAPRQPAPQTPATPAASPAQPQAAPAGSAADPSAPDAVTVYFPVPPAAQYLASYDAGRGQRYYLYGSTLAFAELVAFYRMQLKDRGDLVFQQPPTHMFSIGRFREETMAFPPGVTIKDWTFGGSQGYPNPRAGGAQARFPSVVMIVPPPPAAAPAAR